ncbi:histidine phosphatase family protein [Shinella sp. NM-101]|uniref:histidine phosphatase family protein n=1 Tax=Shinella sp. NM-101 TaxID=2744455 RepID=UPI001F463FA0
MFALYITHPEVAIDPAVPVPDWDLSGRGRKRAALAAAAPWAGRIGRIVASTERKAIEAAEILAAGRLPVETDHAMGENDRSATGFLPPDAFEAAANEFFAHPQDSFYGWERAVDAQARIVAAVERVLATHDPAVPIAFVGHGGVGTLLKCHLAGTPIRRDGDQPTGGGNLFAFCLADRSVTCDWTAMESWKEL